MCGLSKCPITARFLRAKPIKPIEEYMGATPSVFVGSYGYPNVALHPLMTPDCDHPPMWMASQHSISDIVGIRAETIRGRHPGIDRYTQAMQEIALSIKPLDIETRFSKPVFWDVSFGTVITPVGRSGDILRCEVLDNASVPRVVDKITSDTDLHAVDACQELIRGNADLYQITQLFSAGLLGTEKRRRIVPTRWSITATDDIIAKNHRDTISRYPSIETCQVFFAKEYGNAIALIFLPGSWEYEMVEAWEAGSLWGGEQENIVSDREGKKKQGYSPIAGGYYASRLAALEYLVTIRRCAQVLVVRYTSKDYWAPLGVWVVREVSRKATMQTPYLCDTPDAAALVVTDLLQRTSWHQHATLIKKAKSQSRLSDFW
jgi:hypothetical protein